jgi:Domain of unknown function (DUF4783)
MFFDNIIKRETELYMKKTLFLLFGLSLILSSFTFQKSIDDVINAMKSGNASGIAKYFDAYVDITIAEKSNNYSKSQGELVIKDFFNVNQVKGFDVKHKGNNDNGDYCIGTLQTKNGNYRATVYMRMKGNKQIIQEIRIQ